MRKIKKCIIRARISAVQRLSDKFSVNIPVKDKTLSKALKMLEKVPPLKVRRILLKKVINQHTDRQLMVNKELILKHLPGLCQTGINCPSCGSVIHSKYSFKFGTSPEFNHEYMSYNWFELWRCNVCDELFVINNGT